MDFGMSEIAEFFNQQPSTDAILNCNYFVTNDPRNTSQNPT